MDKLLTAEEVAIRLKVATRTLDLWYKWKKNNMSHPLTDLLPDYIIMNKRRYWKESDITKLKVFQASKPVGRGGLFAKYTYHKSKEEN